MDKLVASLGITSLSKSQVSQMAKELDAHVEDFRTRSLSEAGPFTFVAADALVLKVREGCRWCRPVRAWRSDANWRAGLVHHAESDVTQSGAEASATEQLGSIGVYQSRVEGGREPLSGVHGDRAPIAGRVRPRGLTRDG
jgi:hypothetical protein